MGIYHPDLFINAPNGTFPLPDILRSAMDAQLVSGEKYSGLWCDVGNIERLKQLEQKLR